MNTKLVLWLWLTFLAFSRLAYALEVKTHTAINEKIAKETMNGFSLDSYLKTNLGITGGVNELFKDKDNIANEVYKWIKLGGEYEDVPHWYLMYLRSKNHFHNPINEQGFSGIWDTGFLSGISATQWALLPPNTQSPGGYYSWADVRGYYFNALTSADKTARDTNFAETFRGLGQLMHLVQDMSVPEHTRNDGHYVPYIAYEDWVKRNPGAVTTAAASPTFFTGTINNIASFMDTNQYTGTDPQITKDNNTIGLSEFTNANFFSDDSIFTGFTYPSIAGASLWTDTTNNRQYLKKTTEGVSVEHLAASSWLYFYRRVYFPQYPDKLPLGLDSRVYSDYATLLPRAVGYSAGLLNYFFRGQMDMVKNPNNLSQYIIKNNSDETMGGVFSLYYDDVNDNRYLVNSWNLSGSNAIPPHGQSNPVTFVTPTSPQPKEKWKYTLVFEGNLGNEIGAVVGKVVSGLCNGEWVEVLIDWPCRTAGWYNVWGGCKNYYDASGVFYQCMTGNCSDPYPTSYVNSITSYYSHVWAFGTSDEIPTCPQDRSTIPSWCAYNSGVLLYEYIVQHTWQCP